MYLNRQDPLLLFLFYIFLSTIEHVPCNLHTKLNSLALSRCLCLVKLLSEAAPAILLWCLPLVVISQLSFFGNLTFFWDYENIIDCHILITVEIFISSFSLNLNSPKILCPSLSTFQHF